MAIEKRDPIKKAPLRDPGQSLREQFDDFVVTRVGAWLVAACVAVIFVVVEWYRWAVSAPYAPVLYLSLIPI